MRILFFLVGALIYGFSNSTSTGLESDTADAHVSHFIDDASEEDDETYDIAESASNLEDDYEDYISITYEDVEEAYEYDVEQSEGEYVPDDNPVTWDEDPDNYPHYAPDTYTNVEDIEVQSPTHYNKIPPGACAICRDGTYSFSRNRKGTCSHHGGVAQWLL